MAEAVRDSFTSDRNLSSVKSGLVEHSSSMGILLPW
jgi:hypothetical protein